jgi:hypothetical protein
MGRNLKCLFLFFFKEIKFRLYKENFGSSFQMSAYPDSVLDSRFRPSTIDEFKKILVLYLWDMFDQDATNITIETRYIRKAVWNNRDAIFRNRAVFHYMIRVLFFDPWTLQANQNVNDVKDKLRDFFLLTMKVLILLLSPQDLLTVKNEWYPNHKISSMVVYFLSNTIVTYNISIYLGRVPARKQKEIEFVNECRERWLSLRGQQAFIGETFLGVLNRLPQDLKGRIVNEADHTDANWTDPTSRQEVLNYINGLEAWHEI